jgi:hypothetical protein
VAISYFRRGANRGKSEAEELVQPLGTWGFMNSSIGYRSNKRCRAYVRWLLRLFPTPGRERVILRQGLFLSSRLLFGIHMQLKLVPNDKIAKSSAAKYLIILFDQLETLVKISIFDGHRTCTDVLKEMCKGVSYHDGPSNFAACTDNGVFSLIVLLRYTRLARMFAIASPNIERILDYARDWCCTSINLFAVKYWCEISTTLCPLTVPYSRPIDVPLFAPYLSILLPPSPPFPSPIARSVRPQLPHV